MKRLSLLSLVSAIFLLSSCTKGKEDFGGLRTDDGSIVTEISDVYYNTHNGYDQHVSFSFTAAPATETIQFFTLKVSQARDKKISGPMNVAISAQAVTGYSSPISAISIPATVSIPASDSSDITFPVKFTVNKAALNPSLSYAVKFKITSVSQGTLSAAGDSITVLFDDSKYAGRYNVFSQVVDAQGVYGSRRYPKTAAFVPYTPTVMDTYDFWYGRYDMIISNLSTGAATLFIMPEYEFSPTTDKVIGVYNAQTGAPYTVSLSTTNNQFTYKSNVDKSFSVTYTYSAGRYTVTDTYQWAGQAY